jgi:hypothetical protein
MRAKFKNGVIIENATLEKKNKETVLSASLKSEYLSVLTDGIIESFTLLTDTGEVEKEFKAPVNGMKTRVENDTLYIVYETDDTDEVLAQNKADIDAINEAIASLAEIVGGE